ncbi:MAG: hypothetical protein IIV97_02530 [Oscillospiraceae bacterium]|nr:hypothetical protein [Oscillospiraceae bacterium]
MEKQQKNFILILAAIGIVLFILFLIFVPDMSTTLINTVPEYPPESGIVSTNEALITSAVTIDKTNVKNIVSALSRPEEYYCETQSILSHATGSATYKRERWVKGDISRVDVSAQNGKTRYIYSPENVYVWRDGSRSYHTARRGEFEPDDEQMMMTYEDLLGARNEDIVSASLVMYEGSACIYAEARSIHTDYSERYWISSANGLLVHGQTLDENGEVIYSISTKRIDIAPQDDSVFRLPDGKLPE